MRVPTLRKLPRITMAIRLSDEEHARIERAAELRHLSPQSLVRRLLLDEFSTEERRALVSEIGQPLCEHLYAEAIRERERRKKRC